MKVSLTTNDVFKPTISDTRSPAESTLAGHLLPMTQAAKTAAKFAGEEVPHGRRLEARFAPSTAAGLGNFTRQLYLPTLVANFGSARNRVFWKAKPGMRSAQNVCKLILLTRKLFEHYKYT